MAGIYLHVPFCRKTCHYCDFHFSTSLKNKDVVLNAMIKEIEKRKDYLDNNSTIETIYFGGGTPSLLEYKELQDLLDAIYKHYKIAEGVEITLEANPDDLSTSKVIQLRDNGINRLSIGVQSFFDEDLKLLNRIHSGSEAKLAIQKSQDTGIENITIDYIYAIPGLSDTRWQENLSIGLELKVPHISAYCLTVEENTPLEAFIKKGAIQPIDEEQSIRQFEILMDILTAKSFEHYEISNFAKPNFYSKHNSSYWDGTPYIGIGPSAHSFDGNKRQWNIAHNIKYANAISNDLPHYEQETLANKDKANEFILTRLRLKNGINTREFETQFGDTFFTQLMGSASNWINDKYLLIENNHLKLTKKGKLVADRISAELFV